MRAKRAAREKHYRDQNPGTPPNYHVPLSKRLPPRLSRGRPRGRPRDRPRDCPRGRPRGRWAPGAGLLLAFVLAAPARALAP